MGRLFPLLALADLALIVVALIDCLSVEEFQIRALPRVVWVFLILLFSPVGPIAWFVAGRPERATAGTPDDPVLYSAPGRSTAPDDDPEFLGRIARSARDQWSIARTAIAAPSSISATDSTSRRCGIRSGGRKPATASPPPTSARAVRIQARKVRSLASEKR